MTKLPMAMTAFHIFSLEIPFERATSSPPNIYKRKKERLRIGSNALIRRGLLYIASSEEAGDRAEFESCKKKTSGSDKSFLLGSQQSNNSLPSWRLQSGAKVWARRN